ncbi:MAG: hypothetical protein EOO02_14410 [Chitinophagaceae bacterium]|nr:MAG: hypothetical protein EOO02_14410 [Chitinophagaceae bacterium]
MKTLIVAALFLTTALQTSAQDTLTHSSALVYNFKGVNLILVSQSATELSSNAGGSRSKASSKRIVSVRGSYLKVFLTTIDKPFYNNVKTLSLDYGNTENHEIAIENLEIKIGYHAHEDDAWKGINEFPLLNSDSSISLFPIVPGKLPVTKGDYHVLFSRAIAPYQAMFLTIRNRETKEILLHNDFTVTDSPVLPNLKYVAQSESEKRLIDSFRKASSRMQSISLPKLIRVGSDFVIEMPKVMPALPNILINQAVSNESGLVLYFTQPGRNYPDSSLEYRLISTPGSDPKWIKTGHRLTIPDLVPGNRFKLQIRYELHSDQVQEHSFYVIPKWYQTAQTKIIVAAALIVLALCTWLLIYRRRLYASRIRKQQLSLEIKAIRSQLNPHFIFNALSSIQGLINKNDVASANRYLSEFSTLLRDSLQHHDKDMVPLVTEISLVETYLKLEQLRFNFRYEIEVDADINKNAIELPYLILQPLVENAVKHGVSTLAEKGFIKIAVTKKNSNLHISVIDNGGKFVENASDGGFGLKLTRNRIVLLNQSLPGQPVSLSIHRSNAMETIVLLAFKNWIQHADQGSHH